MYNDFKVANYSKALLSPELYARHLSRLFTGDVADGLTVSPGTGLQVVLAPGNAMLRYGSANVASARLVSLVANFNLSIGTPDLSNPRIDLVVVYVDNAVALPSGTPTSANLDGLGVAKAKIVSGTPGATPVAPNASAIQSSVGAGNPYTVVGQVRVDVGVSVIAANKITDVRDVAALDKSRIVGAHHNALFFNTAGPSGGQVINSQTDMNFNASESDAVGIAVSGASLVVSRTGVYDIKAQTRMVDASSNVSRIEIVWLGISLDGTNWAFTRMNEVIKSSNDGSATSYAWTTPLPAGARVKMQAYTNPGSIRYGAPAIPTGFSDYQTRRLLGTYLAVTECR